MRDPRRRSSARANRTIPVPSFTRLSISTSVASRGGTGNVPERREDGRGVGRGDHRPDEERLRRLERRRPGRRIATIAGTTTTPGSPSSRIPASGGPQDVEIRPERRLEDEARQDDRQEQLGADEQRRRHGERGPDEGDARPTTTRTTEDGSVQRRVRIATATDAARSATSSHRGPSASNSCIRAVSAARADGSAGSPLGARLSDVDALDDPEADREADQRGAAVGDEGQRNARDRHEPMTMPRLTISWNRIIEASPLANIIPNGSLIASRRR